MTAGKLVSLAIAIVLCAPVQAAVIVDLDGTTLVDVERGLPATSLLIDARGAFRACAPPFAEAKARLDDGGFLVRTRVNRLERWRSDGTVEWSHSGGKHFAPMPDGGAVFFDDLPEGADLVRLAADGSELWRLQIEASALGGVHPQYADFHVDAQQRVNWTLGPDGLLFVGTTGNSTIGAVDSDGRLLWKYREVVPKTSGLALISGRAGEIHWFQSGSVAHDYPAVGAPNGPSWTGQLTRWTATGIPIERFASTQLGSRLVLPPLAGTAGIWFVAKGNDGNPQLLLRTADRRTHQFPLTLSIEAGILMAVDRTDAWIVAKSPDQERLVIERYDTQGRVYRRQLEQRWAPEFAVGDNGELRLKTENADRDVHLSRLLRANAHENWSTNLDRLAFNCRS